MASVTRSPQSGTASRRAARQAEIGESLLAATEALMAEGVAFTGLSVDRLATSADLLRRLAGRVFEELGADGRQWWDVAERADVADVRRAMRAIVDTYRRHRAVLTAVVELAAYDRTLDDTYRSLMDAVVAAAEPAVGRALGGHGPVHEVATALSWMVERTCHQGLGRAAAGNEQAEALAEALTEVVWRTLYLRPAARA